MNSKMMVAFALTLSLAASPTLMAKREKEIKKSPSAQVQLALKIAAYALATGITFYTLQYQAEAPKCITLSIPAGIILYAVGDVYGYNIFKELGITVGLAGAATWTVNLQKFKDKIEVPIFDHTASNELRCMEAICVYSLYKAIYRMLIDTYRARM